jgi:hypothetical protein
MLKSQKLGEICVASKYEDLEIFQNKGYYKQKLVVLMFFFWDLFIGGSTDGSDLYFFTFGVPHGWKA